MAAAATHMMRVHGEIAEISTRDGIFSLVFVGIVFAILIAIVIINDKRS